MKVVELRSELGALGLDKKSNKAALVARLKKALEAKTVKAIPDTSTEDGDEPATPRRPVPAPRTTRRSSSNIGHWPPLNAREIQVIVHHAGRVRLVGLHTLFDIRRAREESPEPIPEEPKPQPREPYSPSQEPETAPPASMGGLSKSPLAGLAALGLGGLGPGNAAVLNPAALAALAGSQLRSANQRTNQPATNQQSHEMTVPNELIGCIIGKGGTKIAEIRQISGAMIWISKCGKREGGATDRTITISGNPDSVALAKYLINMSVELQKANLEGSAAGGSAGSSGASPLASAIPLAQLLSKGNALGELLGGAVQTTGVHRAHRSVRRQDDDAPAKSSKDRHKNNPY